MADTHSTARQTLTRSAWFYAKGVQDTIPMDHHFVFAPDFERRYERIIDLTTDFRDVPNIIAAFDAYVRELRELDDA